MASPGFSPALRTIGVGILLTAVWGAYAMLTKPLLTVERKQAASQSESFPTEKSPVFSDKAAQWFPQDPWVREAKGRFRDGGRMLYFEQHQLMNENRSVLVKPIFREQSRRKVAKQRAGEHHRLGRTTAHTGTARL